MRCRASLRRAGRSSPSRSSRAGAAALAAARGALLLGAGGGPPAPPGAIELADGVPVGVQDTPAGALAAADNYLALASQIDRAGPGCVRGARRAGLRARRACAHARAGRALRASDTRNMSNYAQGGRASRGDRRASPRQLHASAATVTSWLGGFVWGPDLSPRQTLEPRRHDASLAGRAAG